jgi:hypothetical protein
MFDGNPNLRSVRLSVEDVYSNGNGNPMESMFKNCSALEDVEISCNPQGMSFTNGYEMIGILQGCPNLKSVVVRGLSGVGNGTGTLQGAFQNCNSISSVSFPDLVQPYGNRGYNGRYAFLNAFNSVSSMKELRFGAGTEGDVTRLDGWNTTFGMTQEGREHCSVWCGAHMIKPYDSWEVNPLSGAALRFVGTKDGAVARISKVGNPSVEPSLETSEDFQSWNPYIVGNEIQLTAGQMVYLRASQENERFSQDNSNYFTIDLSNVNVNGSLKNLMTPLSDGVVAAPDHNFRNLFNNVQLTDNVGADINLMGISSYGKYAAYRMFGDEGYQRKFTALNIRLQNNISVDTAAFSKFALAQSNLSVDGTRNLNWQGLSINAQYEAFREAFSEADSLENISVGIDMLSSGSEMYFMFQSVNNLKTADIYVTPTYNQSYENPFEQAFAYDYQLHSVKFRGLSTLQDNQLGKPFVENNKLSSVEFPDLVSCQQYGISGSWGSLFNDSGLTSLSVIRFGHEEVSADILSSAGWDTLWGVPKPNQLCVWAGSICLHSPPPPWSPDTYIYKTSDTAVNFPLFTFEGNSGYPEFRAELCGTANGTCYIGFGDNDNADYRLFDSGSGTYLYMDCGSNRAGSYVPQIGNRFGLVSAWNCGFQVSTESQTGYKNGTPTTDTLSGVIGIGSGSSGRFAIGRLSVLENGALTHLYVPYYNSMDGAGLSDVQTGNVCFPETQGVWEYYVKPTADSDQDGIPDVDELNGTNGYVTDPYNADTDYDGLTDGEETITGAPNTGYTSDPTNTDTDYDGLDD